MSARPQIITPPPGPGYRRTVLFLGYDKCGSFRGCVVLSVGPSADLLQDRHFKVGKRVDCGKRQQTKDDSAWKTPCNLVVVLTA